MRIHVNHLLKKAQDKELCYAVNSGHNMTFINSMEIERQIQNAMSKNNTIEHQCLPILPLKDVVVFPNMIIPLFVGRSISVEAIKVAKEAYEKRVFLVAQKDAKLDDVSQNDLYSMGTVGIVLQMLQLSNGTVKILVEGIEQAKSTAVDKQDNCLMAELNCVEPQGDVNNPELSALKYAAVSQFEQLVKLNKRIPIEVIKLVEKIENPFELSNSIAAHLMTSVESLQQVLETTDIAARLNLVMQKVYIEIKNFELEQSIQQRVKDRIDKNQRQYYIREKINALQDTLSEMDDKNTSVDEWKQFEKRIAKAGMPSEVKEKALSELNKLKLMPSISAEATVSRNYVEWLMDVPWKKCTSINLDLKKAKKILDTDHYGLEKVKERILEYLAVQHRVKKLKGPLMCLVGPPGVGKTSLGQSIAKATGRKYIRMSLGGVRDEAEIRGHRRTYIGALPGKIIQQMKKSGVCNPLFLLDEVDKMGSDFRGDPAAALLEVLDPEQNFAFNDHYLEVDYDLSNVMFIATANTLNIPLALADRMEVISLPGYTESEKLHIAVKHLIPKQIEQAGLEPSELMISKNAVIDMIRFYTKEAGVRNLEREISKICRKVVRTVLECSKDKKRIRVQPSNLEKYLGVKRFRYGLADKQDEVGQVTGLAWTEVGGELLKIEAQILPGRGKSLYTGHLGEVMQESIHAAMTVVRVHSAMLGIPSRYFQKHDFHIHVPEGATPKDGPSAGIGMCTALVSAVLQIPVRANVAMTGEITLRGEVLPIGGLKEKLLAALRGEVNLVIIPEENAPELRELPSEIHRHLTIKPVKRIEEVWELALTKLPKPMFEITHRSSDLSSHLLSEKKQTQVDQTPSDPVTEH
jgi:ATP-dependent Lon protease